MQNKPRNYLLLAALILIMGGVNIVLFQGNPSDEVKDIEEKIINDITGAKLEIDSNE